MLCPNCMSPHIEPHKEEGDDQVEGDQRDGGVADTGEIEPLYTCTECDYVAPGSEFLPETDR